MEQGLRADYHKRELLACMLRAGYLSAFDLDEEFYICPVFFSLQAGIFSLGNEIINNNFGVIKQWYINYVIMGL